MVNEAQIAEIIKRNTYSTGDKVARSIIYRSLPAGRYTNNQINQRLKGMVEAGRLRQNGQSFIITRITPGESKCIKRGYIRNKATNRCVKRRGTLGKVVVKGQTERNLRVDPCANRFGTGVVNPVTKRCTTNRYIASAIRHNDKPVRKHPKWYYTALPPLE